MFSNLLFCLTFRIFNITVLYFWSSLEGSQRVFCVMVWIHLLKKSYKWMKKREKKNCIETLTKAWTPQKHEFKEMAMKNVYQTILEDERLNIYHTVQNEMNYDKNFSISDNCNNDNFVHIRQTCGRSARLAYTNVF